MKRSIGRFIYDLMVRIIRNLDDEQYDKLMARVYRPEFTRRRILPSVTGKTIQFHWYTPLYTEEASGHKKETN